MRSRIKFFSHAEVYHCNSCCSLDFKLCNFIICFCSEKKSPRDVCKGKIVCNCWNDVKRLQASRCTGTNPYNDKCETCDINTNTGDYENCPTYKNSPGNSDTMDPKDSVGVLSNNDDSSNSGIPKGIDPSIGGTFNENSESSNQDNPKGIDPSNSGGVFSQ